MTAPQHHTRPRPMRPLPFGPVGSPGVLVEWGDYYLGGWSLIETTGAAAAAVTLVDGGDVNGVPVAFVSLGAGESVRDVLGPAPLLIRTALFVVVTSGTVRGVLWAADK